MCRHDSAFAWSLKNRENWGKLMIPPRRVPGFVLGTIFTNTTRRLARLGLTVARIFGISCITCDTNKPMQTRHVTSHVQKLTRLLVSKLLRSGGTLLLFRLTEKVIEAR